MIEDALIGQQLGNFRIDRVLGRGGMAVVYYGWDVKLERPVAIKVIDTRYRDRPSYATRFVREARSVATWRHENIVQIYHADEQDGFFYFVMEYIEGMDLDVLLAQYADEGQYMTHDDVLLVGKAVAKALDYAHQQGIIHRDVKPSNVMVTSQGRVVLTDFGLAMDTYRGSMGEVFGTPHYISPEQARSSADAVPQSDLYSLGVMLYEMLTGSVPFDDPSPTAVALAHLTQAPPPPCELNPALNPQVEAVLLKALSKTPQERYATGGELLAALEEALAEGSQELAAPEQADAPPSSVPSTAPASLSRTSARDRIASHLQSRAHSVPGSPSVSRPESSLLGRQLDEYRLETLLGKGGMARVYRGLDVRLKRRVAIKVIDAPFRADTTYMARFEREAQAIARLEHPHIVRLYRYGESQGLLYMAMQYIEGATLESVLANYRAARDWVRPEDARRIVHEICLALDYAHSQGVIHRDIKPSNVMLDRQGHVYLSDFGLALLTELGTRGEILGSPHYIAPEQAISSAKVVPQSDLYAVGVILYEMFTGQVPFDAEDPLDVAMLHTTEPPRPPRALRPEISPALEAVILKALAKEPTQRYGSGRELVDALDRALAAPSTASAVPPETIAYVPPPRGTVARPQGVPQPVPAVVAAPAAPGSKTSAAAASASGPSAVRRKRTYLLLAALLGIAACVLLPLLTGGAFLVTSGNLGRLLGRTTAEATTATGTPGTGKTPSRTTSPASLSATATQKPAPSATRAAQPTSTPSPRPTSTPPPTPTPLTWSLLLIAEGEDSLFVANPTSANIPLAPLRFGDSEDALEGTEWEVKTLGPGECVTIWKEKGHPRAPKVECTRRGEELKVEGAEIFWKSSFSVYYGEVKVGTCKEKPKTCVVIIPQNR